MVGTAGHSNRCLVSCVWCRQSGQWGVGCVSGDILCKYDLSNGDLFVRSCASVLRVPCFRVFSCSLMSGAVWFSILLGVKLLM